MEKWVIEKRFNGQLDLSAPQPDQWFGAKATTGITANEMARIIYRHVAAHVVLDGRNIAHWPALLNEHFYARLKTW